MLNKNKRLLMGAGAVVGTAGIVTAIAVPLALRNKDDDKVAQVNADLSTAKGQILASQAKSISTTILGTEASGKTVTVASVTQVGNKVVTTGTLTTIRRKRTAPVVETFVITLTMGASEDDTKITLTIIKADGTQKDTDKTSMLGTVKKAIEDLQDAFNEATKPEAPVTPPAVTNPTPDSGTGSTGGTGTGTTQPPAGPVTTPAKYTYKGHDYATLLEAQHAADADIAPLKVFTFSGATTEYATADAAKDAYITANASTTIETRATAASVSSLTSAGAAEAGFAKAGHVVTYYAFGGVAYTTQPLAQAAWLAAQTNKVKQQGVDTVTYTTSDSSITLTKSTEEFTRDSATATTAPTITFTDGVKSGTNGVAPAAGTAKAASFPASPSDTDTFTVDAKTYTYKEHVAPVAEVVAGWYENGNASTTAFDITTKIYSTDTDGEYTTTAPAAADPADVSTETTTLDAEESTVVDMSSLTGTITIDSKSYTHLDDKAEIVEVTAGWYDGDTIVSSLPTIYQTDSTGNTFTSDVNKAWMEGKDDGTVNSEITTYKVMAGSTQIGTLVVNSDTSGTAAPTGSFTPPSVSVVTVTVAEKTAFIALAATDAPAASITEEHTTGTVSGGEAVADLPAATTNTVYVFGGNAYPSLDDAKAAMKAALKTEVTEIDSATKVVAGGTTYDNKAAAYTALITTTPASSASAVETIYA